MLSFVKYQGAGNDFVLIDDRNGSFSLYDPISIQKICHRKLGVGADGLILLQKDFSSDFRMRIFNCDGYEAESCGNGLRCLARFIYDLGLPEKSYRIGVGDRIVEVSPEGDLIAVAMGEALRLELNIKLDRGLVHFVNTGVPHIVHFVDDVNQVDLALLGPHFRHHSKFQPAGANVNVASFSSGILHARTFERGVEGETLACGTGALAIATVAKNIYQVPLPISISFKGGDLKVDEIFGQLKLIGPAMKVYQGFC